MGEFLAALFHLLPHRGPVRSGICGFATLDRSLCVAHSQTDLAAISHGLIMGSRPAGCGLCVHKLGLAVAGAVMNGTAGAFGTVIPLISLHSSSTLSASGLWILTGTALMLAGGAFWGWSGYLREVEARDRESFSLGVGFLVAAVLAIGTSKYLEAQ